MELDLISVFILRSKFRERHFIFFHPVQGELEIVTEAIHKQLG